MIVNKKNKILKCVLFIVTIGILVYQVIFEAMADMPAFASQSIRIINGDIPLVDLMGPYAICSWVFSFIYKIPGWLGLADYEYGVLINKALAAVIQFVVGAKLYQHIRMQFDETKAILCGFIYTISFVHINNYLFIGHYNIAYWCVGLSVIILCKHAREDKLRYIIEIAVVTAIGILAFPTYIVMGGVIFLWLFSTTKLKRSAYVYAGILVLIGIVTVVLLLRKGCSLLDILNLLDAPGHTNFGMRCLYRIKWYFMVLAVVVLVELCVRLANRFLKMRINSLLFITIGSLVGVLFSFIMAFRTNEYRIVSWIASYCIFAIADWCIFFGRDEAPQNDFYKLCTLLGISLMIISAISTGIDLSIASFGMIYVIIAYICSLNDLKKTIGKFYIALCMVIILKDIIVVGEINGDRTFSTGMQCTKIAQHGLLKGVRLYEEDYENYELLSRLVSEYIEDDDRVIFIGNNMSYTGYSMTQAKACVASFEVNDFSVIPMSYFIEKTPSKIVVLGTEQVQSFLANKYNADVLEVIMNEYDTLEKEGNYLVMSKKEEI